MDRSCSRPSGSLRRLYANCSSCPVSKMTCWCCADDGCAGSLDVPLGVVTCKPASSWPLLASVKTLPPIAGVNTLPPTPGVKALPSTPGVKTLPPLPPPLPRRCPGSPTPASAPVPGPRPAPPCVSNGTGRVWSWPLRARFKAAGSTTAPPPPPLSPRPPHGSSGLGWAPTGTRAPAPQLVRLPGGSTPAPVSTKRRPEAAPGPPTGIRAGLLNGRWLSSISEAPAPRSMCVSAPRSASVGVSLPPLLPPPPRAVGTEGSR
mmetsp:Transcript_3018/g.8190  ORF Transcript_3018/g.8190 Transcript_3018/m.8190 type:complete len:261 (-) Transcript_3018:419-1201(-)